MHLRSTLTSTLKALHDNKGLQVQGERIQAGNGHTDGITFTRTSRAVSLQMKTLKSLIFLHTNTRIISKSLIWTCKVNDLTGLCLN